MYLDSSIGSLYVVSTPIGNMSDITFNAVETLKKVELILSEDTRETAKILDKFDIKKPQISYRDQNHEKVYNIIKSTLESGKDIALVSDSGTPLISDPGFKLVHQLTNEKMRIISVPGPSAVVAALSVSGLPTDKFTFLGFLPRTPSHRKKLITDFGNLDATLIMYESPFRVAKLLQEIKESLGNRKVCLVNDLTKMYEKIETGDIDNVISKINSTKLKGEFVVLVAKSGF